MMDIYDDLDNYLEVHDSEQLLSENKELKTKLEENSVTLNKLKEDFDRLSAEHQLLLKNFSALLKTAKAEIERKTQTIMQINIEKDELFLRLASSRFNGKKPMSQKNHINEHFGPKDKKTPASPVNDVPDAKDVVKKEIDGARNKKYATRQQKKIDKSSLKEVQKISNKNAATDEVKESCRDKENQVKVDTPVAKVGMLVDTRLPNTSKMTSDEEEGEIADDSIDLRNKLKKSRSHESTHPFAHTKEDTREARSNKHSRNKEYEMKERDLYRHKDMFRERSDSERQHRSRAQERDFSNKKDYQRGSSRHRVVDSPSDRYYRDKSRGRREHKQDRYVNESEFRVNERVKHKVSDADSSEPLKKRRRHSMYEGPEEVRSRRQSEHFEVTDSADKPCVAVRPEGSKGSILGERLNAMTCQSPDDPFAERNVPPQPWRLISQTATTKLDDPRQSSRRYIQIQDRDHKPCLVAARGSNVQLMKVPPWIVVDSKPADEDKIREIYADIDKQINNMSIEADKSSERKDKSSERKDNINEKKEEGIRLPNNNESIVPKEDDVNQAVKKIIDSTVPIKKYVIPKKTPSSEKVNSIKKNAVATPLEPIKKTGVCNTSDKPILSERDQQVSSEKSVAKIKHDKQEHKEQIEIKTNDNVISSYTGNNPELRTEVKQSSEEHATNIVHENVQPEKSKPEPCNPLQILFNHLKLAQVNSQNEVPNSSNKDEISSKASAEDKPLNHSEAKFSANNTTTVQKSIVEGDLELSDETSDFTPFNERYSQKIETPKKKKTKKVTKKDVKDSNEPKTNSETKTDKKTLEIKAKFSDLFGDTSCSLITPEDLNLPRPGLENYPCMPSMESTNEPWSLQNSPWKPEIDNPEPKTDKITEEAQVKEEVMKQKPDETSIVKSCDKSNGDKILCERDFEPAKSVSTPRSIKAKTLPNGFENHNTDFQTNYKTPIKALATSTPLRPIDKISNHSKITASSLSMIPEISSTDYSDTSISKIPDTSVSKIPESSLSKIPEERTDLLKDLTMSDSSKSHTAVENDTPDVRIVLKRKKRVLKK